VLFVGDDWAENHHDVEILDESGRVLARRRLSDGLDGMTVLHALIGEQLPEGWSDWEPGRVAGMVKVGIETDRGAWVAALVARYRERHSTSGAKSDSADAHVLAEIVRLDRAHHRPVAGDSEQSEAIKLTARTHQSLIWDRTRHVLRLRSALAAQVDDQRRAAAGQPPQHRRQDHRHCSRCCAPNRCASRR